MLRIFNTSCLRHRPVLMPIFTNWHMPTLEFSNTPQTRNAVRHPRQKILPHAFFSWFWIVDHFCLYVTKPLPMASKTSIIKITCFHLYIFNTKQNIKNGFSFKVVNLLQEVHRATSLQARLYIGDLKQVIILPHFSSRGWQFPRIESTLFALYLSICGVLCLVCHDRWFCQSHRKLNFLLVHSVAVDSFEVDHAFCSKRKVNHLPIAARTESHPLFLGMAVIGQTLYWPYSSRLTMGWLGTYQV